MEAEAAIAAKEALDAWLAGPARRIAETRSLVEALAAQLVAAGLPVERLTTGIPVLHPQMDSASVLWLAGRETVERRFRWQGEEARSLASSPVALAYDGKGPIRCRIGDAPAPGEFPIIADLRAEGFTDYLALSLPFSDGSHKAIAFATRAAAGFSEPALDLLRGLAPALAGLLEIQTLRRSMRTLLDTYVGPQAAGRILEGAIKRGMVEDIGAIVLFCDLRGFTALSDSLDEAEIMRLLNDYFGAWTEAVEGAGGEVLKFIGDALLAIFPLDDAPAPAQAEKALAAVKAALERLQGINAERRRLALPEVACGAALHVGRVLYGNIGGTNRLDFTVIGPAVNLASRIEDLTKSLGRPLLLSAAFAALLPGRCRSLGRHAVEGLEAPQEVFAPAAELAAA